MSTSDKESETLIGAGTRVSGEVRGDEISWCAAVSMAASSSAPR